MVKLKHFMILALALAMSLGAWAQGLTDTEDTVSLTHDATFSVWTLDAMPDTDAVLLFTPAVPHSVTFAAAESGFSIAGGAATVSLDGQAATLTDNALQAYPGQTVTLTAAQGYKFRSATASETQAAPATLLTLTIGNATIYYLQGETWAEAIANHPTENHGWEAEFDGSGSNSGVVLYGGYELLDYDVLMYINPTDIINPTVNYHLIN